MGKCDDLTGKKFNKLTVIKKDGRYKSGNIKWLCQCECGNYTHALGSALKSGQIIGCKCVNAERMVLRNTKHGDFGTRLYEIWRQMHRRCYGKNTKAYKDYGGRGIEVCKEWQEYAPFREWAIANGYAEDLTIDRIDVNGNYETSNCRWATVKEQANNRRSNHIVEYNGERLTVSQWSDRYGVSQLSLWARLSHRNWDVKEALASMGVML